MPVGQDAVKHASCTWLTIDNQGTVFYVSLCFDFSGRVVTAGDRE